MRVNIIMDAGVAVIGKDGYDVIANRTGNLTVTE